MRHVAGQSSVELLVSAAVIVPFILLIPTLANLLLVQTEAHKAARHVAWERAAYPQNRLKDSSDFEADIEDRFLRYSAEGFGNSVSQKQETAWRDWGVAQPVPQAVGLVDYDSGVHVAVATSRSATEGYGNTSAFLANRGGANAIQLNTLQSGEISIGIKGDSSLLARSLSSPAADPVTGEPRYFVRSSSALVVDSWVPPNDAAFHDRVGDIGGAQRNWASLHAPITALFRPIFRELDHLFVDTPGTTSAFDMVDPQQSTRLPDYLKQPE